jgi:hypothetical protein
MKHSPALNVEIRSKLDAALDVAVHCLTVIAMPAENESALERAMREAAQVALSRVEELRK